VALGNISATGTISAAVFGQPPHALGNTAGNISPNIFNGSIQTLTATGDIVINDVVNIVSGQSITLLITQDATGNRTLTSTMKFASNVRTLSTAANSTDIISIVYVGTVYYASLTRGYV
jgi:hypothetical protein